MKFLLPILLASCMLKSCCAQETEVVKIGAIFFDDELELVESLDAAIGVINEMDYDIKLEAIKHYLTLDDSIALQEVACNLIENGVAAIFGPSSKTNSDIVEVLCNITGIPHLQFDWHAQETERHRVNHQMTVNVAPTELQLSMAYFDILTSTGYNWRSFTIVYERETSMARLQHVFASKFVHKTGIKMQAFERGDDYRVLWKRVNNAREKYVLLECPPDILTEVINASRAFNMTGPFNHLFLTNLDSHMGGIDKFYSKEFTVNTAAVRLRSYIPPPVHDETDVFDNEYEENKLYSVHAQLIYDAVVLYFNALRELIGSLRFYTPNLRCGHGYWRAGPHLVQLMKDLSPKNVRPPYSTQRLKLNEHGERDDFNLEIYNPLTERILYVWNKDFKLVPYEKISENSTKEARRRKLEVKEDFSQKRVRYVVATRVGEPYFMWREEPEGVHFEGNERFEGYAVDLIYNLARECKFDFSFEPVPDNAYGSYNPVTDEWNGIIRQLMDNNAQIGICDLTITQARRSVVDFTVPFMQLGISILSYKEKVEPANLYAFLNPYQLDVWLYLLVMISVTVMVLVMVGRLTEWEPPETNDDNEEQTENIWHVQNSMWLVLGSILNQGCDILPRGFSMRVLTAFWWIFALLISQTYIAQLAAFITSSKMKSPIKNLHDLVEQNKIQFGTIKGGATSLYFSESNDTINRVAWNKMLSFKPEAFTKDNKEGVDRVKRSGGDYAFLMETTSQQYFVQRNCDLRQIGEPIGEKHYGIAVPLNAPFRSNLSVGILHLSEKGELYKLKNKWFNVNETERCDYNGGDGSKSEAADGQFGMDSVGGLFIVLIVGIIISIIIAICEFLWHVQRIAVKERLAPMVALKAEFRFFISFWLQRKPLHTYRMSRGSTSTGYSSYEPRSSTPSVKKKKKLKQKASFESTNT